MVVNYARNRITHQYIFLERGEFAPLNIDENQWVWYDFPLGHPRARYFTLVGESATNRTERLRRRGSDDASSN
jgi:hypothetical protein